MQYHCDKLKQENAALTVENKTLREALKIRKLEAALAYIVENNAAYAPLVERLMKEEPDAECSKGLEAV